MVLARIHLIHFPPAYDLRLNDKPRPSPLVPRSVAPLPDWAIELPNPQSDDGDVGSAPTALVRGWKLHNDTIVCRACCPQPAGAVPVTLVGEGDNLCWEESAAEAAEATPVDGGAPADGGPDMDDADAEESAADDQFGEL
ncbi:hypothetical protein [Alienimonas californiensis]|uniref:hypothetical protein n=1 Tax=Alienimonas californiensis TaxID=2527989 RepID=UPI0011A6CE0A|nr:hypothetical protein [Alienimonas californiensis]